MSTFLINASNLKIGGGVQVADSICRELHKYSQHFFVVVLSSYFDETRKRLEEGSNYVVFTYDIKNSFRTLLFGRDTYLDSLVVKYDVSAVLTIFGPSRWNPKCKHLSGFARPHLVLKDSPFYSKMTVVRRIKEFLLNDMLFYFFKRSSKFFWTENPFISARLAEIMPKDYQIYTVSNYYNQIFDHPELYKKIDGLDGYEGITCLSISSYKDFKNFEIIPLVVRRLKEMHPNLKVRFLLTLKEEQLIIPTELKNNFVFLGNIDVAYCPYLYQISDIMFMPTLMECFTATFPEAMKMGVPIVTTDLNFNRGLCGDAACYYSALDAEAASDAIYKVSTDKEYADNLVAKGSLQLKRFLNYEERAAKLISILEEIADKNGKD